MTLPSPLAHVASRPLSALLLLTLISVTAACSSGSTAVPPPAANNPPPPAVQIEGILMPSSVAVVTATNAQ